MKKVVYVMDSRVSNTPVQLDKELIEEVERRICTLCEDFVIISSEQISLERAILLQDIFKLKEEYVKVKYENRTETIRRNKIKNESSKSR